MFHWVPGVEECRYISLPDVPVMVRFCIVLVALTTNSTFTLSVVIRKVPVVEAELAKVVVATLPLLIISRPLKADVPTIVPENVWSVVPFIVVVPELWVNVPEFE